MRLNIDFSLSFLFHLFPIKEYDINDAGSRLIMLAVGSASSLVYEVQLQGGVATRRGAGAGLLYQTMQLAVHLVAFRRCNFTVPSLRAVAPAYSTVITRSVDGLKPYWSLLFMFVTLTESLVTSI